VERIAYLWKNPKVKDFTSGSLWAKKAQALDIKLLSAFAYYFVSYKMKHKGVF
jgi:hypothetical protein